MLLHDPPGPCDVKDHIATLLINPMAMHVKRTEALAPQTRISVRKSEVSQVSDVKKKAPHPAIIDRRASIFIGFDKAGYEFQGLRRFRKLVL